MDYLPDNQQKIEKFHFYQDLSFKKIAYSVGIGINAALGRMRYVILTMRRIAKEKNIILAMNWQFISFTY